MSEAVLLEIATLFVLGVGAQWVAARVKLPSILLLLVFGLLAGPVTGCLNPDERLGESLFPLVSVSVALILYEGGLTLKLTELGQGKTGHVVRNLCTIGVGCTWLVTTLAGRWILGLDVRMSILLGAILVVTGPTVIGPLLRQIRPTGPVGPVLKWEGIVIDPIGAVLAVLVFEVISGGGASATSEIARAVLLTTVAGGGLGLVVGFLLAFALNRFWVPDFLQNAVSLMLVIAVYVGANHIQSEAGLLAATVMGITLANQKLADVRHIVEFKENLRVLLLSTMFITLAARLRPEDLGTVGFSGLVFVSALVLIGRPLSVLVSTIGSGLHRSERLFLAWVAPRGIVAAAVASVFALRLEQAGHTEASTLVPVAFLVIIGTVAIYGLSSAWVARWLGVADPSPQGVVFIGAHTWTRSLAALLQEHGFAVLLVDSNRYQIAAARMQGLPTYAGSILAEYALDEINLGGLGRVLAVTPNDWVNALTTQRFARVFGAAECYQLAPRSDSQARPDEHKHLHGRWLFGPDINYSTFPQLLATGHTIKATKLSEEFDYEAYRRMYGETALPMFIITESGRLCVITADKQVKPIAGQTLISLVKTNGEEA